MDLVSIVFAVGFYAAFGVLAFGLYRKVRQYWRTPAPLIIPTTPAPTTRAGVVLRMAREVVLFSSLFKASKWTWLFGWLFHAALLVAFLRHLRYVTEPVWAISELAQSVGIYAGFALLIGLLGLAWRRVFVARVRYISAPSDHLMLVLLGAIAGTGLALKYVAPTDVAALKAFMLGLLTFAWQPLPTDTMLIGHLSLVLLLMLIFPFSKLLHAPGVFFSPTRNQIDNPRERRHTVAWTRDLERSRDG